MTVEEECLLCWKCQEEWACVKAILKWKKHFQAFRSTHVRVDSITKTEVWPESLGPNVRMVSVALCHFQGRGRSARRGNTAWISVGWPEDLSSLGRCVLATVWCIFKGQRGFGSIGWSGCDTWLMSVQYFPEWNLISRMIAASSCLEENDLVLMVACLMCWHCSRARTLLVQPRGAQLGHWIS